GEEDALARDAARLAHADRLRALVGQALERLSDADDAASASLGGATHALEQAAALDPSLDDALPGVREAAITVADSARTLAAYLERLEADPERLETIEARRDLIARPGRKYPRSGPELLARRGWGARPLA